ncbi:putative MAP7 domain-containing protein 3-like [Sesbania bispinosa]|nr:putative MAP7 domain-containing protein 3-like [Sesbania bispinosa]
MAPKQQEKVAEKIARKNVAAAKRKELQAAESQGGIPEGKSKPKRQRAEDIPIQEPSATTSPAVAPVKHPADILFRGSSSTLPPKHTDKGKETSSTGDCVRDGRGTRPEMLKGLCPRRSRGLGPKCSRDCARDGRGTRPEVLQGLCPRWSRD